MKRRAKSKNRWADHYTRQARKDKYPARSVYKLKEIQQRFKLIRPGDHVLDLGCYPGSWTRWTAQLVGGRGSVVGIDLKAVSAPMPANVRTVVQDFLAMQDETWQALNPPFNVLLSDMAPATTGNKHVDTARSLALCEHALAAAISHLHGGGHFVCKVFQGTYSKAFSEQVQAVFHQQRFFKPRSSRKASKEIFILGLDKRI
jgi:23S rRNA (uridine2552-2'-O)-methyltransferase